MELLDRLIKFAILRPRSEFEIKHWLSRKKVSDKDAGIALRELKKAGLIDDRAFCNWWIEQRLEFRPKSQQLIIIELVKKGIDKELAKEAVRESGVMDEEMARLVIGKRSKSLARFDPEKRKKKITNILLARGFGWGVIKRTIAS